MKRNLSLWVFLVCVIVALSLVGCNGGESDPEGDEPDGDEIDGDGMDGDGSDGDMADGDIPDGDEPDGDVIDGDGIDGDIVDGDEIDGDDVDGDDVDGDSVDGDGVDGDAEQENYFRIAVISGLKYSYSHYSMADNLNDAISFINARDDVDFVLVLGDLTVFYATKAHTRDEEPTYEDFAADTKTVLDTLTVPYYIVPGDMDYTESVSVLDGARAHEWVTNKATRTTFLKSNWGDHYPGTGFWYSFEHRGINFVGLNTMLGDYGDPVAGHVGSITSQAAGLQSVFTGHDDVIVFGHHQPALTLEGTGETTYSDVIAANNEKVKAVFSASTEEFRQQWFNSKQYFTFGSTANRAENVAIVEIPLTDDRLEMINKGDLHFQNESGAGSCTPGSNMIADESDLLDTIQGVFISSWTANFPALHLFWNLIGKDQNHRSFPLMLHFRELVSDVFTVVFAFGQFSHNAEAGTRSVTQYDDWYSTCEALSFDFDNPCLVDQAPNSKVSSGFDVDLLGVFDILGYARECGATMPLTVSDYTFTLQAEEETKSEHSTYLSGAEINVPYDDLKESIETFMIQAYCTDDCTYTVYGDANCYAGGHGHTGACLGGTLAFADIPSSCDYQIGGSDLALSLRTLHALVSEKSGETITITTRATIAHQMVIMSHSEYTDEGEKTPYSLNADAVFNPDNTTCPEAR